MDKAIEDADYDAATGSVIVKCQRPDGGTFDIQVDFDAAEAIVQAFRDAMPEPALGLEDTGVYHVRDLKLISTTDRGVLLDLWTEDGRKARFVLPQKASSRDKVDRLSRDLRRLLKRPLTTYSH